MQEAAALGRKAGLGTEEDRIAHAEEVQQVLDAVDTVTRRRADATRSREKRRGGRPLPELGTKEANAEAEELFADAFAYVAELEDAADGHLGGDVAFKPTDVPALAAAKARLSATIADAASRQDGGGGPAGFASGAGDGGEPVTDPVGVVSLAGVLDVVSTQSRHAAESNVLLAVVAGPPGDPPAHLAALVEAEAVADAAMATATLRAACLRRRRTTCKGSIRRVGSTRRARESHGSDARRDQEPSERRHDDVVARLRRAMADAVGTRRERRCRFEPDGPTPPPRLTPRRGA